MNSTAPRFGLKVGQDASAAEMRDIWRTADDGGFDHLWCLDLFAAIGAAGPDRPIFEGWALQAAMAVATSRVRIGATFTGNTHREPWQLAKLAATVDHLSGGRLEFGIGAGYEEVEHRMYHISLAHRVGRLAESLECLTALWTQDRVDFNGRYYTLTDAFSNPRPVQQPHPPIWIGASGEHMLRVAAKHTDVWNCPTYTSDPMGESGLALYRQGADRLNELCTEIGRNPADIRHLVQVPWNGRDRQWLIDTTATWLDAGCSEQIVYLHPLQLDPPGTVRAAQAAADLLPELRKLQPA